jgi:branched-chain amino acid transport system substrate-binding protein
MFKGLKGFKKVLSLVVVLILLVGTSVYAQSESETYKIGAILPLTGRLAFFGEGERNALSIAEEKINQTGGINGRRIRFVIEDSKGQAKEGVTAANKLIRVDNVKILITSLTSISYAVQPIADKAKVIQFAFCMDPEIAERSPYTFRIYPGMRQQSQVFLDYLRDANVKRVSILYLRNPAAELTVSKYLKPGIENAGREISVLETFDARDMDLRSQALKIKNSSPEVLIPLAHFIFMPKIFKALNEVALLEKVQILGGLDFTFDLQVPEHLLEGVVFVSPSYEFLTTEKQAEFKAIYQKKYSKRPGYDVAFFYDGAMLLAEELKKSKGDVGSIRQALLGKTYEGVSGKISILPNGDADVFMKLGVFRNGKRVSYE